ncbi:MAG: rRNA pseudouridine synthase [Deltaproteobacteria bacterium]|nr:rRNA pseudouridine synthase [Deltaproteobacteria bacterium]
MQPVRLQKFLSMAGFCSRRKGEVFITQGRVKVNGQTVTELGTKIDPANDRVEVDGQKLRRQEERIYIALNKPRGYVTSCAQDDASIVTDLIDIPQRVYPIGRLDKDSTGLLLLTNDGALHHRLLHPSFDHEKEYVVTTARPVSSKSIAAMRAGMVIQGEKTRPARVKKMSSHRLSIQLKEGKNRQIRRMIRKGNNHVTRLKRIRVAGIHLGDLPEGSWRYLTEKEILSLEG